VRNVVRTLRVRTGRGNNVDGKHDCPHTECADYISGYISDYISGLGTVAGD